MKKERGISSIWNLINNFVSSIKICECFLKMKVQSSINEFNDSIKIFGLKRGAK